MFITIKSWWGLNNERWCIIAGHFGGYPYSWGTGTNSSHIARYFICRGWIMPGETVLDAGCGTGYGTKMISQVAKKAIGVDVDKGCVAEARLYKKKYPKIWGDCTFRTLDLGKDELPDVDVVISIEATEHVRGLEHFVEQLHKHTKRMFIICVPFGGTSHAYKDEPASPATEKNDFVTDGDFINTFVNDEWKLFTHWMFGYSIIGVFFKEEPKPPKPVGDLLW